MKQQYDMTMLESVVADNTPKELAAALQAILLDSCVYYTDVASRGKVKKVLHAFERFQRSLGTILSGDKGIGKSVFAKLLCQKDILYTEEQTSQPFHRPASEISASG